MSPEPTMLSARGGCELIQIPAGEFVMGSPDDQKDRYHHEGPVHRVQVPSFHMGRFPVTNEEYGRFLLENPGCEKPPYWGDGRHDAARQPAVGVSWDDARRFAEWAGGRLPSEAEWEYACRAGSRTRYCNGDAEAELDLVGWYDNNSDGELHPIGEKLPNVFGLHDMHGSVWEWCEDDWHADYRGAPEDGSAWIDAPRGAARVVRGGSWRLSARLCRSASRLAHKPEHRFVHYGFRLAASIPAQRNGPSTNGR